MFLRQLRNKGLNPLQCEFEMFSFGPLYPEQGTLEEHRRYRDIVAPMEKALASYLDNKGLEVLGSHPRPKAYDEDLFTKITAAVDGALAPKRRR